MGTRAAWLVALLTFACSSERVIAPPPPAPPPPPPPPVSVNGIWDWTEEIGGCSDTGSYAFNQSGTAFGGRSDQVGLCVDGMAHVTNNAFHDSISYGTVSGQSIQFNAAAVCHYTATAYGAPTPDSLVGAASCAGSSGTWRAVPARPVATADLTPDSAHVVLSWTRIPKLVLRDAIGHRVFRAASWSSADPLVASVDSDGVITGLSEGTARIVATIGGLTDTSVVDVAPLRLAFLSRHDGTPQVYIADADGSNITQLTQGTAWVVDTASGFSRDRLQWSPDGTKLVLSAPEIAVINASNGAEFTDLSQSGFDPAWSPDNQHIRFLAGDSVYDMAADGSDTSLVATPNFLAPTTPSDSGANATRFAWSPDLSRVAFQRQSTHFFTTVYMSNADGTALRKTTTAPWAEGAPAWSPDGTKIAFWSCGYGLSVINSDGSGPIDPIYKASCGGGNEGVFTQTTWSPDGNYVIFTRISAGPISDVWVVDVSGRMAPRRISPEGYDAWAPALHP